VTRGVAELERVLVNRLGAGGARVGQHLPVPGQEHGDLMSLPGQLAAQAAHRVGKIPTRTNGENFTGAWTIFHGRAKGQSYLARHFIFKRPPAQAQKAGLTEQIAPRLPDTGLCPAEMISAGRRGPGAVLAHGRVFQIVAHVLLVEGALWTARTVFVRRPEARGVGREHFVNEKKLSGSSVPNSNLVSARMIPARAASRAPSW